MHHYLHSRAPALWLMLLICFPSIIDDWHPGWGGEGKGGILPRSLKLSNCEPRALLVLGANHLLQNAPQT